MDPFSSFVAFISARFPGQQPKKKTNPVGSIAVQRITGIRIILIPFTFTLLEYGTWPRIWDSNTRPAG